MNQFTCNCEWQWIITKKHVFGPIVEKNALLARIRTFKNWEADEGDCARNWELHCKILERSK